jgi:serine/threonine protein kinase
METRQRLPKQGYLNLFVLFQQIGFGSVFFGFNFVGRLHDVLHIKSYHIDSAFRYSIVSDVAQGMSYLHKHGIIHGQLTSSSCYVDGRFNILVGDWEVFALHEDQKERFLAFEVHGVHQRHLARAEYHRLLFWSAPEVIEAAQHNKETFIVSSPTKPADVYSYAVVMCETFVSQAPFDDLGEEKFGSPLTPHQVVQHIKQGIAMSIVWSRGSSVSLFFRQPSTSLSSADK